MSLKAPLIAVGVPIVDATGCVTPEALGFFLALWNRTNGAVGPIVPLTGSDEQAALLAQLIAD